LKIFGVSPFGLLGYSKLPLLSKTVSVFGFFLPVRQGFIVEGFLLLYDFWTRGLLV